MNIIIFYEHIVRELDGCNSIISEINKYDDLKAYKYSIIFEYYKALRFAKKEKIDMVIMPWLYSEKDYELVVPFIKLNPDVLIVNLHHEQVGSVISDGAVIPRDEVSRNSVIHFVWGENFRDILIEAGVNKELIFVTGNIRTDFVQTKAKAKEVRNQYSRDYGLDLSKKWILYSENRDWVWGNKDNMKKTYLSSGCSEDDFDGFYKESLESINTTIKDIQGLEDSFFEMFEIIYRPHPGALINNNIDKRINIINKGTIYEWLYIVDANIASGSTTVFESELCGVPTFTDISFYMDERYQTYGMYDYYKIKTLQDITNELLSEVKKSDEKTNIYEKYIGVVDGKVANRIAKQVSELLNTKVDTYSNCYVKVNKTRFYGKLVREKIIEFLYKKKILYKFNWPKYAIRMKEDIPY